MQALWATRTGLIAAPYGALSMARNNWRKHRQGLVCERAFAAKLDPYASGLAFDGWAGRPRFTPPEGYESLPVSPARTALLRSDWERFGLIDLFEMPSRRW